jgi:RNA polymerase sigma-54 factor
MQETWQMGVMTLCRIAHHVVMVQQAFFTQGRIALKILRQVDVGDALSLHSSTVSRACQAVSLQIMSGSMAGVMSLNDLFCRHASHQKALSSEAMVVIMQQLIRHEASHKPLSDQKLVDLLAQQGIQLARRTVAKIRELHGILPARLRKNS